jgi:predicted kinase
MELIVFVGLQGSGKSFYYKDNFVDTHVRINLDMLRTRHREMVLFEACLKAKQPVVIDNTNLTVQQRLRYLVPAKAHRFTVVGYYFNKTVPECLANNKKRDEKKQVPEVAIFSASKKLEIPTLEEGFDKVYSI